VAFKLENLRDHMNDLELIFSMLGEASTTEIAKNRNTKGFIENEVAAKYLDCNLNRFKLVNTSA